MECVGYGQPVEYWKLSPGVGVAADRERLCDTRESINLLGSLKREL